MRAHRRLPIDDISQVGEARRAAQALALEQSFDEEAAGRVALAVTELGTNLVRHVGPGRQAALLLAPDGDGVQVLSLDQGGGMDLARCLQDGYSTAGSSGTGLGAIRRMAERFNGFSAPGRGTVLATRFSPGMAHAWSSSQAPAFDIAGLNLAAPGEEVCGDAWACRRDSERWTLVVADGLGHGPDAARAADRLTALLAQATPAAVNTPATFLERSHDELRSTRGAAATAVTLTEGGDRLLLSGAGNVTGRLISGVSDRTLLSQHGTLGLQIRRLQDVVYDWPAHAVLVLHSDGIVSRWSLQDTPGLLQSEPAVIAGWILRDHLRGRDDATVVVVRRNEAAAIPGAQEHQDNQRTQGTP
ncbi:hypothetical protein CDN99_07705 [Roseateles aquatilis]|uniref:PPM-type phosphatase domain-containing protein n=1 Tax=Roseateles aquatilis TaxID=431061 RepID=A0A246JHV5_9BURK|nr:ATP-binding protein [Roseateles aquatilis]OWQ92217.1 hypothetical protein CDN99_07705 [Roseateles aquatilis]